MAKKIVPIVVILSLVGFFAFRAWRHHKAALEDNTFYGTVEAVEVLVSSQLSGRVLELNAKEGGKVKKGELLAVIDESIYQAQLDQAKAANQALLSQEQVIDASISALDNSLSRARRLYKAGAGAKMHWEDLSKQREVLKAQRESLHVQAEQTEAAVNLAEKQLGYCRIYSPLSGTVLRVHTELGETAFPGSALLTIADLTTVEVKIYVPEPMLGKIKLGDKVELITDTFPDRPLPAMVSYISDQAEFTPKNVQTKDERVRLVYAVKVSADNTEQILKIGMPVDARFAGSGD